VVLVFVLGVVVGCLLRSSSRLQSNSGGMVSGDSRAVSGSVRRVVRGPAVGPRRSDVGGGLAGWVVPGSVRGGVSGRGQRRQASVGVGVRQQASSGLGRVRVERWDQGTLRYSYSGSMQGSGRLRVRSGMGSASWSRPYGVRSYVSDSACRWVSSRDGRAVVRVAVVPGRWRAAWDPPGIGEYGDGWDDGVPVKGGEVGAE